MLSRVATDGEEMAEARRLAERVIAMPPLPVALTKATMRAIKRGSEMGDAVYSDADLLLYSRLVQPARYGGEEFGVVLSETDIEKAARFGEKIRTTIERTEFTFDTRTIKVTASIGVSTLRARMSRESFVHAADQALYQAKQKGRNRLVRSDSRGQPS